MASEAIKRQDWQLLFRVLQRPHWKSCVRKGELLCYSALLLFMMRVATASRMINQRVAEGQMRLSCRQILPQALRLSTPRRSLTITICLTLTYQAMNWISTRRWPEVLLFQRLYCSDSHWIIK